ncbi:hypothetical protein [Halopseudomonas laoshanensis]|uniref:hypothetical protein n=1 Tax=Halopseudomonas laoshanensis TaxID=2268758 RepID=UPI0037353E40
MLISVSPYLLEHTDLLSQTLSYNYLDKAHRSHRRRDRLHIYVCSLILTTPEDRERFIQLTTGLQLDSNGRRAAVVIEINGEQRLEELVRNVMVRLRLEHEPLHTSRHGKLMLWVPLTPDAYPIAKSKYWSPNAPN